jgi:hypothetical protein
MLFRCLAVLGATVLVWIVGPPAALAASDDGRHGTHSRGQQEQHGPSQSGEAEVVATTQPDLLTVPLAPDAVRKFLRSDTFAPKQDPDVPVFVAEAKPACGMPLIPADPSTDPEFIVRQKESNELRYTMRSIPPPMCR